MAVELATAYVSLSVSTKGMGRDVAKQFGNIQGVANSAGVAAGKQFGKSFNAQSPVDLKESVKRAADNVEAASSRVRKARISEEAASRKVEIAETKLSELRDSGKAKASQILAAEDQLASARVKQSGASAEVAKATADATKATDQYTNALTASEKVAGAAGKSSQTFGQKAKASFDNFRANASSQVEIVGEKIKSSFVNASKIAGAAVVGILGAAVVKGWGRLTAIENAQAKLKGLGHDAGSVQAIMDNALASVKGTSFGLDEAATTAAGAVAAGIKPGTELEKVLKSVANSSAAAGIGMDEMGGIYNKVASIGKAQNDVLQQVADRGIPIYQSLAEQLGVTTDEVFKMASKGQISFKQFQTAMTDASGTVADEMGKTTTGALANLWAALGRFGAGILEGVFPQIAPLFGNLTEKVDGLAAVVAPVAAEISQNLVTGIINAVKWMQVWWPLLATIGAGIAGYALVIGTIRVATGLWAAAQWALNAAMTANPIGLIIAGVAALVAGVILAYNKVGWFRTAVDATFNGIKFVVGAVVLWFQTYVAPVINTVLTAIGGFFTWLWKSVIVPVFNGIKFVISAWWLGVKTVFTAVTGFLAKVFGPAFKVMGVAVRLVFQLIRTAIQIWWAAVKIVFTAVWNYLKKTLGPVFQWLYKNVIKPVWNGIKTYISTVWAGLKIIFSAIVNFIKNTIQPRFKFLLDTVKTVWAGIKRSIKTVWDFIKSKAFDPLAKAVKNTLPSAFRAGKNAIGKAWDGLKAVAKKPVKFVVDTVINKGIIDNFNKIAKVFGADSIDPVKLPKGFATGGYTGAGSKYTPAGVVHADEYVLRKEAQNKISRTYGRSTLDFMNRTGRIPGLGYAKGGKVKGGTLIDAANWWVAKGAKGSRHPAFGGAVRSGHSKNSLHYQDRAVDLNFAAGTSSYEQGKFDKYLPDFKRLFPGIRVIWKAPNHWNHMHIDTGNGADIGNFADANSGGGGGIASFLNPFQGLIDKVTKGVGKSGFGKMIGSGAKKAIQWPIDWLSERASMVGDFVEGGASKVVDFAKDAGTKAQVRTVATGFGWGFGKQWDAINWLVNKESGWDPKAANPRSSARGLFQKMTSVHGPVEKTAGGQANWGLNYVKGRYGTPVGAMNFHKRKGYYANGGLVSPTLFDKGGVLSPGTHLVANKTKRPEYILPAKVTDALLDGSATNSSAPIIQVTTPVVERNEVDEWTEKVRFAFNHMSKTSAFAGVNG